MVAAAVMTYDSLVSDVTLYLERSDADTINQIPRFIMLAEQVIATNIKFLGNLVVATGNFTTSDPVLVKPSRWKKTVSMSCTDSTGKINPVLLRKYEVLRAYAPDPAVTGTPKYYSDYNFYRWLVAPTPASDLEFEVTYYERVEPLSSDAQANWFTINAPQALLYGTLLQAIPFLKNDDRIPVWQSMYNEVIESLKTEDVQRILDRQAFVKGT
jgi:hypothetical protein